MKEVHQRTHVNVVWAATEGSPRPVDVPLLSGSGTGERVAKAYGCELRRYGRVMTVFPALPEGEGPAKIHAARLWAESFGGSLQDTSRTLTEKAKSLSHSLPTGVHTVSSLSARDQATVYALARYGDMGDVAGQYASMFAFDAGTMKCGPKPQGDGAGATP